VNSLDRKYWDSALLSSRVVAALEGLRSDSSLQLVFPEVEAMVGFGGDGHKELWPHTKQVVSQTICTPVLRWAALFHDVGKVKCFTKDAKGKIAFIGHEKVSARLFAGAAKRVNSMKGDFFTMSEIKDIKFLIYNLGYIEEYDSTWSDSAVRRLQRLAGPYFNDLVALARADISSKNEAKRRKHFETMKELQDRSDELYRLDAIPPALISGLGEALTKAYGIPPSKELGVLMRKITLAVENEELPRQSSVETVIDFENADKERFL
jgi:poly(A) polymerase